MRKHKRAVLRWIESHKGAISTGTLYGWLIYPVREEASAVEVAGWGSVARGRGSRLRATFISWVVLIRRLRGMGLVLGLQQPPWLSWESTVCLSLPTGISILPWAQGWHLPESSAEELLHYLHLGLMGRSGSPSPKTSQLCWSIRAATQQMPERPRLVQHRDLQAPYYASKRQPHCCSVPFTTQ